MTGIRRAPHPSFIDRMRECDDKEKYDRAAAESRAAVRRKIERNKQLVAYQCKHCERWHIGHKRQGPT